MSIRRRPQSIASLITLVVAATAVTSCGSSAGGTASSGNDTSHSARPFETIKGGVLTVAVIQGNMPRTETKPDGTLGGQWGYVITRFAEEYGLTVKPFTTNVAGEVLAIQNGRADIASAAYNTEERQKVVYFTAQDLYDTSFLAVRKDFNYTGPESLKGKKFASSEGFSQNPYLEKTLGKQNVLLFPSLDKGVQAVRNGQADAVYGTNSILEVVGGKDPDLKLVPVEIGDFGLPEDLVHVPEGPIVSCQNKALAKAYNDFYLKLAQTSEYQKAFAKLWEAAGGSNPEDSMILDGGSPKNGC